MPRKKGKSNKEDVNKYYKSGRVRGMKHLGHPASLEDNVAFQKFLEMLKKIS